MGLVAESRKARRRSPRSEGAGRGISDRAKGVQAPPVVVLNPTAAGGKAGRVWRRIRDELRYWRTMPTVVRTEHPGHATEIARAAAAAGSSLVIAAGGDGTAHEVVQGLMEVEASTSGTAFAHIPLGTGCDLARGLNLPLNPTGILRGLRQGRDMYIDVGVADMAVGADTVRRYFLNAATVGLGPAVVRRLKRSKRLRGFGKRAYSLAALKEVLNARPYQVSWRTDDGSGDHTLMLQLFISNGPSVAGGMRPSPNASFSNGELHIVMVGALGLTTALHQFFRLESRRPFNHPDIHSFVCRSIDLEGPELDVETDGEIVGGLPARLWVRPGGLLVRMPA